MGCFHFPSCSAGRKWGSGWRSARTEATSYGASCAKRSCSSPPACSSAFRSRWRSAGLYRAASPVCCLGSRRPIRSQLPPRRWCSRWSPLVRVTLRQDERLAWIRWLPYGLNSSLLSRVGVEEAQIDRALVVNANGDQRRLFCKLLEESRLAIAAARHVEPLARQRGDVIPAWHQSGDAEMPFRIETG